MDESTEVNSNRFYEMCHFLEGVFTREEEKNCIGLVLFKPDSVTTGLDLPLGEYIQQELERSTGKPVGLFAFTQLCLDSETVGRLYQKLAIGMYFHDIVEHLTSGPVSLVLVASKDAPQELNRLKGSVRRGTGIRGKFSVSPYVGVDLADPAVGLDTGRARDINTHLYVANLLHVPDNCEDTKRVIELLLPKNDLNDLVSVVPLFSRWFNQEEN